jgi:hypothetical protein
MNTMKKCFLSLPPSIPSWRSGGSFFTLNHNGGVTCSYPPIGDKVLTHGGRVNCHLSFPSLCRGWSQLKAHFTEVVKASVQLKSSIPIRAKVEISPKGFTLRVRVEMFLKIQSGI